MKKLIALFAALLLAGASFAQTKVDAKKLAKALESNKDSSAVFVSELDLSGMKVADDGKITLPLFAKSKAIIVAGMDMANIKERIEFANKKNFEVTFEAKELASKKYALTNIEGIESVAECADRLKREAKERAVRERAENLTKLPVQIVSLDAVGLTAAESEWLPYMARDSIKSNLYVYLGMNAVLYSSDAELKKIRAQNPTVNEKSVSEFSNATEAKFILFESVKKTAKGYFINAEFVDLTTGELLASVASKEYATPERLLFFAGAVDEITLSLAGALEMNVSDENKKLLANGPANFNKEKLGFRSKIYFIEAKKKELVDARNKVEARCQELFDQLQSDRVREEQAIKLKEYGVVELGSDGQPTAEAKERRERQIAKGYKDLTNKFFSDCDSVKASAQTKDSMLLAEIRADQKALAVFRTAASRNGELKIAFDSYEGDKNGWKAKVKMFSDGVSFYEFDYILPYEALSGKKAPNMKSELNDAVVEEYQNNVEKYTSLLKGDKPPAQFEVDYTVSAMSDDNPSAYTCALSRIRVVNVASGKIMYSSPLSINTDVSCKEKFDLRIFAGVEEKEKDRFDRRKYPVEKYMARGLCKSDAEKTYAVDQEISGYVSKLMVKIPGKNIKMMSTEVTQRLYQQVMGENPSNYKGANNPVENVSWYDAIYFCNVLSEKSGYEPVYSVNGETDVSKWGYTPHNERKIEGGVTWNEKANGFRLSTEKEWEFAANGGQNFTYSGSNNLDAVGWYERNSGDKTHPVAQKRPNGYGLYDMSGNVCEWVWDADDDDSRDHCGGSYNDDAGRCEVSNWYSGYTNYRFGYLGFRVARSLAAGER